MSKRAYNWNTIQDYLAENSQAGLQMAVLEADKILLCVLEDLGFPGKTERQKITLSKRLFSDFSRLKEAHNQAEMIKKEPDFALTAKLSEEILAVYYQALLDIKTHKRPRFTWLEKIQLVLRRKIPKTKKILRWSGVYLFLFFLLVLFLDRTKTGNSIVASILRITNFIFSWLIILILLAVGIIATIIGSLWYLRGRRKIDIDLGKDQPES